MTVHKTKYRFSAVFLCTFLIISWFGSAFRVFADDMADNGAADESVVAADESDAAEDEPDAVEDEPADDADEPAATALGDPVAMIAETGESYPSLQDAINAVTGGQTITLLTDTTENVTSSKSYTLNMGGHKIDGGGSGPVYSITGGTVTLQGGTITNGSAGSGGGINISEATVILNGMTVSGNTATKGGGIFCSRGNLTASSLVVSNNSASYLGGGICITDETINSIYYGYSSSVDLRSVRFEGNFIKSDGKSGSGGAALYMSRIKTVTVSGCEFTGNRGVSTSVGSSIITAEDDFGYGGSFTFENCDITGNSAAEYTFYVSGGEDMVYPPTPVTLTFDGCEISGNEAVRAGGIYAYDYSKLTFDDTIVKNNKATGTPGDNTPVSGGIVCRTYDDSFIFNSGAVYDNISENADANDLFLDKGVTISLITANTMNDAAMSADGGFSKYVWQQSNGTFIGTKIELGRPTTSNELNSRDVYSLTAVDASAVPAAEYKGTRYGSVADAIDAAKSEGAGSADIKLLPGIKNGKYTRAFYFDPMIIDIPVVLDLNACTLNAREDILFEVRSGASLKISGTGQLKGPISVKNGGTLSLATDITGLDPDTKNDLSIDLESNQAKLKIDSDFVSCGNLIIKLSDADMTNLNKTIKIGDDFSYVLVENGKDKIEPENIEVVGLNNVLAKITFVGNDIVLVNHSVEEDKFVSSSGNDNDAGTLDQPLKTVWEALKTIPDGGTIYIIDTVNVSSETWDGGNKDVTITRYGDGNYVDGKFDAGGKNMFTVSNSLELMNITIDGGGDSIYNAGSIISLSAGAELTLGNGAVLQNNHVDKTTIIGASIDDYYDRMRVVNASLGGAVYASSRSTINIENGSFVTGCSAFMGGAIYSNGKIYMDGGKFEDNKAEGTYTVDPGTGKDDSKTYRGSGGAIVINGALAEMTMSGGSFINNRASYGGGAISLGTGNYSDFRTSNEKATFTMTGDGGIFSGNTAGSNGGALFVQSSYKAVIEAGEFTGNSCGSGNFGGGAIYVNGGKSGVIDGELWLSNVLITRNTAGRYGGGIAGCNTSGTIINMTGGSVIYRNSGLNGDLKSDISVSTSPTTVGDFNHSKHTQDHFTQFMLDGKPYNWKSSINVNGFVYGDYVSEEYLNSGTGKAVYTDETPSADALNEIKVFITENSAGSSGGGIGSNGSIFIGGPDYISPGEYVPTGTFEVSKTWKGLKDPDKEKKYPSSLKQLNIWVLYVDGDGVVRNKIHNPLISGGDWRESITFELTDIDENCIPVVLEEAVYKDGRHVWFTSDDGRAYEDAVNEIMDTMDKGTAYIWSDDETSPYKGELKSADDGSFTFTNEYIEQFASGSGTPPTEDEDSTKPSEPTDPTIPPTGGPENNESAGTMNASIGEEDISAGSGVLHEEEVKGRNVFAVIVIASAASITAAAVSVNIIRRRRKR